MPRGMQQFRRAARVSALVAVLAVGLTGCSAAGGGAGAAPASRGGESPVAADSGGPATISGRTPASGSVRGGTLLTVRGSGLAGVRTLRISGTTVPVSSVSDTKVTVRMPAAKNYAPASTAFALRNAAGTTEGRGTYRYREVDGVDRELHYLLTYWKHYNPAYEPLGDNDCVDFTSQALLQRGWKQQDDWVHAAKVLDSGAAWRSSTAFRDFMTEHPELGTALTDAQRAKVKVGDVVQFDWDRSGDRDHTGVVTRIVKSGGTIRIYFAGHTKDSAYRSVDTAITKDHPGGAAFYWSLK